MTPSLLTWLRSVQTSQQILSICWLDLDQRPVFLFAILTAWLAWLDLHTASTLWSRQLLGWVFSNCWLTWLGPKAKRWIFWMNNNNMYVLDDAIGIFQWKLEQTCAVVNLRHSRYNHTVYKAQKIGMQRLNVVLMFAISWHVWLDLIDPMRYSLLDEQEQLNRNHGN